MVIEVFEVFFPISDSDFLNWTNSRYVLDIVSTLVVSSLDTVVLRVGLIWTFSVVKGRCVGIQV